MSDLQFKTISPQELDYFYNEFQADKTFLQSKNYAQFRQKTGENIFTYGIFKDRQLIGTTLIQKINVYN